MQSLQLTPAISVLVVDDDKVDRHKVRRLLNDICHLVDADSGQNALACLDTLQVNCVLLDYHMPGTDTLELLTSCVERQLPVVMITGEGDEAVVVEAITRGAQDYLSKNKLTQDTLCQTIVRAMEKVSLKRQVQEKQREMEAFVSMAAHDLKSPLRTMVNLCQLVQLRGQAALEAETAAQLDMAVNKGLHLLQFLDELLEYTRVGRSSKPFEPVNLPEILSSIQSSLAHAIEVSNAAITIGFLPTIQGDRTGLTQLFLNLLTNAIKFCGDTPPKIDVTALRHNNTWYLMVMDNGIGIDPAFHELIFQPMQRLHNDATIEGAGLGLGICAKIVEQHQGRIWVASAPGTGSTFHMCFDVCDPA